MALKYTIIADLNLTFGKENIEQWADLDNTEDTGIIAARVVWAQELAYANINDRLRDGPYVIPFAPPIVTTIKDLAARMAGVALYDGRLIREDKDQTDEMGHQRVIIEKLLRQLLSGQLKLNLRRKRTDPQVITDA